MKKINQEVENKIQEVNRHLASINLTAKEVKLKSTKDFILYYTNFLDSSNKFLGLIEFPNLSLYTWLNYLCNTEDKVTEFMTNFYDEENIGNSLMSYRRHLINNRNLTINGDSLQKIIDESKWSEFWDNLQELFLDYCHISWLTSYKEMISEGLTAEDIVRWYQKKGGRLLTITTFPVSYVKETVSK